MIITISKSDIQDIPKIRDGTNGNGTIKTWKQHYPQAIIFFSFRLTNDEMIFFLQLTYLNSYTKRFFSSTFKKVNRKIKNLPNFNIEIQKYKRKKNSNQ
jgi:hypothetical protein